MVHHIFIDNSISDEKIAEEISYLGYLFRSEPYYAKKATSSKSLFGKTAEKALLDFEILTHSAVLLDPLESNPLSKMKLPTEVAQYPKWVRGAVDCIVIHKTNLVQMNNLREKVADPLSLEGTMIVASNNVRYLAYKDYPYVKFISKEGCPVDVLLKKAITYALNTWFRTIVLNADETNRKEVESLRKRIVSAYLLGATE